MLALIGLISVATLVVLIARNLCSPIVALIAVPAMAALAAGSGVTTGKYMIAGVEGIAPVVATFVFAILYFGVMSDAGLLDPLIRGVLRLVGVHPTRIVVGTALLALLVHLDGSGAVCFVVVIPAMLPLYDALKIDRRILACAASMAAGVNFLPWTGPTLRAASALHLSPVEIFRPMIGVQAAGLLFVLGACVWLGRRAGRQAALAGPAAAAPRLVLDEAQLATRRPARFWINLPLTLAVMSIMIWDILPAATVFMIGTVIALIVNYPGAAEQRNRLDAHAKVAFSMAGVLLAAGAFTGIMSGTGMLKAMAEVAASQVPAEGGSHIPFLLALVSMPLSLLFDPDSFYFSVLPILAGVHAKLGGQPIEVAQAALIGQMTTGFPISPLTPATFLVAGLSRIELSAHQLFAAPFLFTASLVMTMAALLLGVFPL